MRGAQDKATRGPETEALVARLLGGADLRRYVIDIRKQFHNTEPEREKRKKKSILEEEYIDGRGACVRASITIYSIYSILVQCVLFHVECCIRLTALIFLHPTL